MSEIVTKMTRFPSDGTQMNAYAACPKGPGPYPTLIVIHENVGLDDNNPVAGPHIKDVCNRFAQEGYATFGVDLFSRGQGAADLYDSQVAKDLAAAYDYLAAQSNVKKDRVGVIGYCMGGRYALLTACHNPKLAACAMYYGQPFNKQCDEKKPQHAIHWVENLHCPMLGIFGDEDHIISPEQVSQFKAELEKNGKKAEIHQYPGAKHAFFNDTRRENHHPEAAKDAWQKTLAFFHRTLRG